jgi:hypothetical protein
MATKKTDAKRRYCGSSTGRARVQTLSFRTVPYPKGPAVRLWTPAEAKAWALEHKFSAGKVEKTTNTLRIRQNREAKKACSYRWISFGKGTGIQALVEYRGSKAHPQRGDRVKTTGGASGLFVGRRGGVDWIAYDTNDFADMVRTFDGKRRKSSTTRPHCVHCKEPIVGQPVIIHKPGKPDEHYHTHHAKHRR